MGSGSDPESQAGRQTVWRLELKREGGREKRMNQDRICWRTVFLVLESKSGL